MAAKQPIKKTGSFQGKSNQLGYGGRSAQLRAQGVPEGVIGQLARKAQAAPGQKNYHGKRAKKSAAKGESAAEDRADKKAGRKESAKEDTMDAQMARLTMKRPMMKG